MNLMLDMGRVEHHMVSKCPPPWLGVNGRNGWG